MPIAYGEVEFPLVCKATVIYEAGREYTNLVYCYEPEKHQVIMVIKDYNIEKLDTELLRRLVSNAAPEGSRGEEKTEE